MFRDFVVTAVVNFVRFLVSFPSSQNHRPTFTLETFPGYATLMVAFVSTALNVIWNASWLNQDGSRHGMGAGPELWQNLGPFLLWSFAAATVLSFFGRGKTPSLDAQLVGIDVAGISTHLHASVRLGFGVIASLRGNRSLKHLRSS